MGWFSKKKKENENTTPLSLVVPHTHTWKDFPWYMIYSWDDEARTADYAIYEPYVCITCGERKDVKLESLAWTSISPDCRRKYFDEIREKYRDYLKPRAIVEDMINNTILVKDINHLRMMEERLGLPHRDVGTSAEGKTTSTQEESLAPKIEVKPRYYVEIKGKI